MSFLARLLVQLVSLGLKLYPGQFRVDFGEEMRCVFTESSAEVGIPAGKIVALCLRELRDMPGSLLREHLQARRGNTGNQNNPTWQPPAARELTAGLTLFVIVMFPALLSLFFGYQPSVNRISDMITVVLLIILFVGLVLGAKEGFPRWAIPYLGVAVTGIVILGLSYRIWHFFYSDVMRAIGFHARTLQVRVLYQTLMWGFFWFLVFAVLMLLVLALMACPRTRKLAQSIHQDWTLFSFMIFGGVVFQLELIFEEYAYDEFWKIACRICLLVGAWIYFTHPDRRKRILAMLVGVTFTYWIAAIGKWYLVPQQEWGAWFGNDDETYRRFEFWRTLTEWGWVMVFMLIPALLTLINHDRINSGHDVPSSTSFPLTDESA